MKDLVISPHVDDEVLACGGILNSNSFVYYVSIDESKVAPDLGHRIATEARIAELKATAAFLGFSYAVNYDNKVNFLVEQDVIGQLEAIINKIRPERIYIPHPGYNQDHRTVFHAAQVALRPHDKNFFVKKVLVYEGIHDFLWSHEQFHPNYFFPIDIERKLQAYALQPSQIRGMRSPDMLRQLAHLRGAMSNVEYAEGFSVLRWID